jgi:excisionase family DNA binding protein
MPRPSRRPAQFPGHIDAQKATPKDLRVFTPAEAADLLKVGESWLRRKAAERLVPCTFVGKHLRFTAADIAAIVAAGATPATGRRRRRRSSAPPDTADLPAPPRPSVHAHRDDPDPDGSSPWHG